MCVERCDSILRMMCVCLIVHSLQSACGEAIELFRQHSMLRAVYCWSEATSRNLSMVGRQVID